LVFTIYIIFFKSLLIPSKKTVETVPDMKLILFLTGINPGVILIMKEQITVLTVYE